MQELAVSATSIQKQYEWGTNSTPVLKGVNLQVRRGECVFLVGPSGSGKSTLLSILGCVLTADAGELVMFGEKVTLFDGHQRAHFRRNYIGFVFQRFHLFRGLTACENVRVPLSLLGKNNRQGKKTALEMLEAVGLADKANSLISQLSLGQQQRVALARALVSDPPLVLADEPTASLDATTGLRAMELVRNLTRQRRVTVIVVTHDSRIFHLADRVLHLEDGVIAKQLSPQVPG